MHSELNSFLTEMSEESKFSVKLGASGGYVEFGNTSGKSFILALSSLSTTLSDILNSLDEFINQSNQLLDYKNELDRAKKESKLYYLTLTGYEPRDKSTNKELIVDEDYFLLSFENHIFSWIEDCIEKSATIPLLREGLVHYRNLISKITNKTSEPMEKEMEDLIIKPKQVEAVQILLNEYPKIWAKKEMEFWDSLEELLYFTRIL